MSDAKDPVDVKAEDPEQMALAPQEIPTADKAWSNISKVVFINLKRRLDRLKEIESEFQRLLIPESKIHRFEAIDGAADRKSTDDARAIENQTVPPAQKVISDASNWPKSPNGKM